MLCYVMLYMLFPGPRPSTLTARSIHTGSVFCGPRASTGELTSAARYNIARYLGLGSVRILIPAKGPRRCFFLIASDRVDSKRSSFTSSSAQPPVLLGVRGVSTNLWDIYIINQYRETLPSCFNCFYFLLYQSASSSAVNISVPGPSMRGIRRQNK